MGQPHRRSRPEYFWVLYSSAPGIAMTHVVLLGDSIFDNGAYVRRGEPDLVRQVQARLRPGERASLVAVDGAVTADGGRRGERAPRDASHLVVSAGGNDALGHASVLEDSSRSIAD